MPTPPSPASLSQLCDASCPFLGIGAGSCRAPSSRAACAPLSPRDITSLLGLCDAHTPRHSPRSCRPSVPTSPLPPAPLLRVGSSCPLSNIGAGSRRVPSSRAACAPLSPRDITSLLASAMRTHRATARDHVDLSCRCRRCRPRRCCESTLLAPLPARRRLPPRAELARLVRASATSVTSPCYRLLRYSRTAPQPDLVSTFRADAAAAARAVAARRRLLPLASSAPAHAERRASAPFVCLYHPVTSLAARPLRCSHTAPQPDVVSAFRAEPAIAARAVSARR